MSALRDFWSSPIAWAYVAFVIAAGFFILTEHRAHAWGYLPYLIVIASPIIILFTRRPK